MAWVVRTKSSPLVVSRAIEESLRQSTGLPVSNIRSMEQLVQAFQIAQQQVGPLVFGESARESQGQDIRIEHFVGLLNDVGFVSPFSHLLGEIRTRGSTTRRRPAPRMAHSSALEICVTSGESAPSV